MTDPPGDEPEKKIIVDEDWKSRVQAEKEALQRQKDQETPPEEPASAAQAEQQEADVPLPPASLEVLAGSLAMQAMIAGTRDFNAGRFSRL